MGGAFALMDRHLDKARAPRPGGTLVFSRVGAGRSVLTTSAPSLKLVLEGEQVYEVEGRTVRVTSGQFLFLDAGDTCHAGNKAEAVGLCVALPLAAPPGDAEPFDPLVGRSLVFSARTSEIGRALDSYARTIARDPAAGQRLAPEVIRRSVSSIAEPLGTGRAAIEALGAAKASTRRALFERLERARGFLHANDGRCVTLAELAAVASLSQFHLARYFRAAFGQPPIAYHRGLRLARAAGFLARDEGGVAEAAEIAGYSDSVALCHAFRRHLGTTPRGLRQAA